VAFNITKETMVSFLVPSQIIETMDDIKNFKGNPSRSSIIRRLLSKRLKSYYDSKKELKQKNNKTNS
jgi:metal-responsive CopG/Arc/MetJ family transcriptional regulator